MLPLASFAGKVPPAWIGAFPHDPDRYIGIGRMDKRSHPGDYRELAQASALAQISREIWVQVKAENATTQRESAGGWEEHYAGRVSTVSRNELSGHVLAGVHETTEEFWTLYTLEKEVVRKTLDGKETRIGEWLEREAAALEAELSERRIQSAVERFERIRKEYGTAYEANPLLYGRATAIPSRYAALSRKMESILGRVELMTAPKAWTYSLLQAREAKADTGTRVTLVNAKTMEKWKGPLKLRVENRMDAKTGACRVETDAEGRLDLTGPFLECGLKAGIWRVSWTESEGREMHVDVGAEWNRMDLGLAVSWEGAPGAEDWAEDLERALAESSHPHYRIVTKRAAPYSLIITMREVSLVSLEGIYFSSLCAEVSIPGVSGPMEVPGKAGHADKARAKTRALQDFTKAMQGIL